LGFGGKELEEEHGFNDKIF